VRTAIACQQQFRKQFRILLDQQDQSDTHS
jgi:hypothetical protein